MEITPHVQLWTAARKVIAQPPTSVFLCIWKWENKVSRMEVIYHILTLRGRTVDTRRLSWVWWEAWRGCIFPIFVKPHSVSLHLELSSAGLLPSETSFFLTLSASSSLSWRMISRMEGIEITHKITTAVPRRWQPCTSSFPRGVILLLDTLTLPRVLLLNCTALQKHWDTIQVFKSSLDPKGDQVPPQCSGVPCPERASSCWEVFAVTGAGAEVDVRRWGPKKGMLSPAALEIWIISWW